MRQRRKIVALALSLLATVAVLFGSVSVAYAADDPIQVPETNKSLHDNGDGTYTLSLSVKGKASSTSVSDKANVIVVFDSSGSMREETSTTVYSENDTGRYGLVNGQYVRLYRASSYSWSGYSRIDDDSYTGTVYYQTGSGYNTRYVEYTDQRYSGTTTTSTRMAVAKSATKSLVAELFKQNQIQGQPGDTVEVAFIDFDSNVNDTTGTRQWVTTTNAANTVIDRFNSDGGTNWEAALEAANTLATQKLAAEPNETVYVVFVSDGNPTFRLSSYTDRYGSQNPDDNYNTPAGVHGAGDSDSYGWNLDAAKKSAAKITGNPNMELYTVGVFGDVDNMESLGGDYYDASDNDALNAAFADIIGKITNALNVSNVDITDQITNLTATTLVKNASDFKYYRSGGDYGTADPDSGDYGKEWTSIERDGANKATFSNDKVEWNLGEDFKLENGVTYTVTFTVWPSQDAYDLVADLNNGDVPEIPEKYKDVVFKNEATGKYAVRTNPEGGAKINYNVVDETTQTEAPKDSKGETITYGDDNTYNETVPNSDGSKTEIVYKRNDDGTYTITKTSTPKGPAIIENPKDAMELESTKMVVEKVWTDELTQAEDRPKSIKLEITEDGKTYKTVELNPDNGWKHEIAIAPGIKVKPGDYSSDAQGVIPNAKGHEYKVTEPNIDLHYEFHSDPVHPMLNGLTKDNKTDMVDLNSAKTWTGGQAKLVATNTVKGGINVKKVVTTDQGVTAPSNAVFTFTIALTDANGNPVYTTSDQFKPDGTPISGALGYRIYKDDGDDTKPDEEVDRGTIPSNGQVTLTMTADQYIRIVNVPDGTKYTVTEGNLPDGFVQEKVDGGSGTVQGNGSSTVTVTNKYEATKASVEKVWNDSEYQNVESYKRPTSVDVTLTGTVGGKTVSTDTQTLSNSNSWKYTWENLPKASAGTDIVYTVTEVVPTGYTATPVPTADGKTTITNTPVGKKDVISPVTLEITKTDSVGGGVLEGAVFTVVDAGGAQVATATTNAGGKATLTFTTAGTYTMSETAPTGYIADPGSWTIVVAKSGVDKVEYNSTNNVWNWFYHLLFGSGTDYAEGKMTITNPSAETKVTVDKTWDDNDNQDGKRPTELTYTLSAKAGDETVDLSKYGVTAKQTVKVAADADGAASYTWDKLPTTYNGTAVDYAVTEASVDGYTTTYGEMSGSVADGYKVTVTNKHEIDKTKVTVTKNWNDNKNADKTRPESVSVTLYADGTAVGDPVTLNEGKNWTYTWGNLDVNAAGKAISYTVDEAVVDGYAKSISDISGSATAGYSYTITNSNVTVDTNTTAFFTKNVTKANTVNAAEFGFSIEAVTVGAPMPENTTGKVSYDARETGEKAINFGKITFTKAGDYTYKITETRKPDGWTATPESVVVTVKVTGDAANGFNAEVTGDTIKNAYSVKPTKASFPVKKVLAVDEGLTAPDITGKYTFTLAAVDGAPLPETTSYINPDKDGGTVTFGEIEYTAAGTYTYTVTETGKVDGVTNDTESSKTITVEVVDNGNGTLTATPSTDENAAVFTNTYEVGKVTASIPVEKTVVVPEGMTGPADWSYTVTAKALNGAPEATSMETTVTKATPTSKIGEIEFTKPGTYTYTVTETGKVAGVTNGTDSYDIEIVVTDNSNGTLTAVVNNGKPVAFENTYNVEPVTASFPVAKKLVVPEDLEGPSEWSYTINVSAEDGAPVVDTMTGTVNQDNASVTFGDFTYTKPGTYTYTVSETGTVSGVTNDAEAAGKTVTVTVVDNGNGTMTAKADSTTDKPLTFTNTYATKSVSVPLTATKTVYGADSVEPFEFSIALKSDNAEGVELASETAKTASKIAEGDSEQVSFGDATFTKPGTYVFTVDETTTTTDDKWVYDDSTHNITVKVTDDGTGQLSAEVVGDTPNFYNTYEDDVKTVTAGTSTTNIDGKPVQAGQTLTYTINWTAAAGGKTAYVVVTDKVPEHTTLVGGSVSKPGVVSEDEDGNTVITWAFEGQAPGATGTVSFQVTVNEDAADTTLTNDATVKSGENGANTNTVTNEVKTGSVGISKVIVSTTGVTDDEAEFAFEVSAKDSAGNPLKGSYDVTVAGEKTQKTFEDGKITFELKNGQVAVIDGLPEGTEYTVKETGEYAGYKLTAVDGEKDETEGKGTIAGGVDVEVHTFKFENTYSASGEAEIPVSKTVTSATEGTEPGDWSFDFTIAAGAYEGDAKDVTVPLPAERTVTLKGTGSNKKVSGEFGEIEYTAAGTYTYTVTESGTEGSANAGISTVGPKTVTVEVTDNKDGSLTATVKDADTAAAFENVYSVKTAALTIPVEKNLSVPEYLDGPSEWSYDINVEAVGNAPKAEVMTGKVDQDNTSITFGEFTYSQPGDYQYTVTETGKVDGVTNDVNGYTVKVNVKDNHDGTLTATANYDEKNPVIFTNTYDVDELKVAEPVKVDKWLTGTNLAAGMFQFEIKAGAYEGEAKDVTVPLPTQTQVANDAKGNVVFGEITFAVPGVYHYTVNEVNGGQQGYSYADNTVDVTITVTDNGNGTMSAETTYGEVKQFENSYKADGKAQFFASKTLKGHALEDGQFTFELVDSDGNVIQTKTNNGAQVVFDPIPYTQDDLLKASDEAAADDGTSDDTTADNAAADDAATTDDAAADAATDDAATDDAATDDAATDEAATDDAATGEETADGATTETGSVSKAGSPEYDESATFTYTIREVDDGAAGYTYDKHDETVKVTVTDNGDGKMNAAVAYDEDGAVFTNHYEATGEAQFNGIKTVEGTELKDGQFKFELVDGQGNVIETVANGADGSFSFSPIAYAQKDGQTDADTGTFEYTIREVNDGQLGYTYDSHVCDVIVTVTDNNNGTLTTAVEYSDGKKAAFNNPYKPLATSAPVTAKKVLEGRDLKAGEFTFELRDAEGKVVATATNAASGLVDFGYVSFDEVGTYTFTAAEVKGADANVTYDSSTKTYTVEVVDDGGQLVATVTCDDPSATFTNVYEKPDVPGKPGKPSKPKKKIVIPQTGDDTPTGAMAALTVFGAAALTAGTVLQRRKRK